MNNNFYVQMHADADRIKKFAFYPLVLEIDGTIYECVKLYNNIYRPLYNSVRYRNKHELKYRIIESADTGSDPNSTEYSRNALNQKDNIRLRITDSNAIEIYKFEGPNKKYVQDVYQKPSSFRLIDPNSNFFKKRIYPRLSKATQYYLTKTTTIKRIFEPLYSAEILKSNIPFNLHSKNDPYCLDFSSWSELAVMRMPELIWYYTLVNDYIQEKESSTSSLYSTLGGLRTFLQTEYRSCQEAMSDPYKFLQSGQKLYAKDEQNSIVFEIEGISVANNKCLVSVKESNLHNCILPVNMMLKELNIKMPYFRYSDLRSVLEFIFKRTEFIQACIHTIQEEEKRKKCIMEFDRVINQFYNFIIVPDPMLFAKKLELELFGKIYTVYNNIDSIVNSINSIRTDCFNLLQSGNLQ